MDHRKEASPSTEPAEEVNGKISGREVRILPAEIWRQHEGKCIIYSEDEQRVIGVGDTWDQASEQAKASGVQGVWHYHRAARWEEGEI